jgi:rhodanese-related sulfurtransferase
MKLKTTAAAVSVILTVSIAGYAVADGNRYNRDRQYNSEISAAEAYLAMENSKGYTNKAKGEQKPVLVDVRSLEEYAAGHPDDAFNVPYPRVCSDCLPQDAAKFYWEVYDLVKGDTDRLVMTLCRTGSRSIDAANILADPANTAIDPRRVGKEVYGVEPFTNVRNIWEGFVGQYKYAMDSSGNIAYELDTNGEPIFFALDLNNKDGLESDTADVFIERKDKNEDKDGWRNFQALPWTTKIRRPLAYMQDPNQYDYLTLTPVD